MKPVITLTMRDGLYRVAQVKSKKDHKCCSCGTRIEPFVRYTQVSVFRFDIQKWHSEKYCSHCHLKRLLNRFKHEKDGIQFVIDKLSELNSDVTD